MHWYRFVKYCLPKNISVLLRKGKIEKCNINTDIKSVFAEVLKIKNSFCGKTTN